MRPNKASIPMTDWTAKQLTAVLQDKKSTVQLKRKVQKIFQSRQDKGWELLQKFFSNEHNKFWNLARWQLYREGKARLHGHGKQARFYIEDKSLIFDKMIEIRNRYSKWEAGKAVENPNSTLNKIKKELDTWKR